MAAKPTHLEPSELGTKEYWDKLYTNEISNHEHNPEDKGTVWFEDNDAEAKMIEYLTKLDPQAPVDDDEVSDYNDGDDDNHDAEKEAEEAEAEGGVALSTLNQATTSFIDLGTGNGSLLFGLRDAGWKGRMLGVDYSPRSVQFAKQIAQTRRADRRSADADTGMGDRGEEEEEEEEIEFREHDILNSAPETIAGDGGWDVLLDKGTFDAISLSSEKHAATGLRASEGYRTAVLPLLREGGLLLITSCNWTEEELSRWFGIDGDQDAGPEAEWGFRKAGRVNYPTFSFGGVKGQTISTLCFLKVKR